MTPKEILTEIFRVGVPGEKLGQPDAAETFIALLPTITEEQASTLLDHAAFETANLLLTTSMNNLMERMTKAGNN